MPRRINWHNTTLLKKYQAELHIHTVLSPCAGVEMIPPLIVKAAIENGINLIAITDHNASDNVAAVIKAAEHEDLTVLPGMELQTQEDVHVLCLFDTMDQLDELQTIVNINLPEINNNIDVFGEQFIVDHSGEFVARNEQLLITATRLSFEKTFQVVKDLGGLFIPAHVNRQVFGLITHLGFVPPDLAIDALEISRHITPEEARKEFPQINAYRLIQSGDVHFLDDFLGVNQFLIKKPTISELKRAFRDEADRKFSIQSRF